MVPLVWPGSEFDACARLLVARPAVLVPSTSSLVARAALFVAASSWVFALGLLVDPELVEDRTTCGGALDLLVSFAVALVTGVWPAGELVSEAKAGSAGILT